MSGLQNKRSSGFYLGQEQVRRGSSTFSAQVKAMQCHQVRGSNALFEGSRFDTQDTPHSHTRSTPSGTGVKSHTSGGPAKAVSGMSQNFKINGSSTCQHLTKKQQNSGNCPSSSMAVASASRCFFQVVG